MQIFRKSWKSNSRYRWLPLATALVIILSCGCMGITAAQWSDSIFVNAKNISTGHLAVQFPLHIEKEISNAFIDADVDKYMQSPVQHELYLTVTKVPNDRFVVINFKIENIGTVPVKFGLPDTVAVDVDPGNSLNAFTLNDWELPDLIEPGQTRHGQVKIQINAVTPGLYRFESIIPALPWNATGPGSWTDTLHVNGEVTIPEDKKPDN